MLYFESKGCTEVKFPVCLGKSGHKLNLNLKHSVISNPVWYRKPTVTPITLLAWHHWKTTQEHNETTPGHNRFKQNSGTSGQSQTCVHRRAALWIGTLSSPCEYSCFSESVLRWTMQTADREMGQKLPSIFSEYRNPSHAGDNTVDTGVQTKHPAQLLRFGPRWAAC